MGGVVVVNQPGVYLVDADGNVLSLADGAAIGSAEGLLLMGKDGSNARIVRLDSNGDLVALPLPAGAATEATLAAADTKLGTIDGVLDSIKDTDGIKKITDELPAGTQEIGSVAQGTAAADTAPWPFKQVSADGESAKVWIVGGDHIPAAESQRTVMLLQDIKTQLRLLNMHMEMLTEMDLAEMDLDEGDEIL